LFLVGFLFLFAVRMFHYFGEFSFKSRCDESGITFFRFCDTILPESERIEDSYA